MTTNEELANWIKLALLSPQVIEDLFYMYPCEDPYRTRPANKPWEQNDPIWVMPLLQRQVSRHTMQQIKVGFDPGIPIACADVLGLALIGKHKNDLEKAWRAHEEARAHYTGERLWAMFGILLGVSEDLCHRLVDWHGECVASAFELAQKLLAPEL